MVVSLYTNPTTWIGHWHSSFCFDWCWRVCRSRKKACMLFVTTMITTTVEW